MKLSSGFTRLKTFAPLLLITVLFTAGCGSSRQQRSDMGDAPTTTQGRERSLKQLTGRIKGNQENLTSFTADCDVLIRSPLLPSGMKELRLSGDIKLVKPQKIRLVLRRPGKTAIALMGDGEKYRVKMPLFDLSYGGEYGDDISGADDKLHFMPDDLADAIDIQALLSDRPKVLRAYPRRWELAPGSLKEPVIYPPTWSIGSLSIDDDLNVRMQNSIQIDRTNEQIQRIDKFRRDGSLRVRMWHRNISPVDAGEDASVRLPGAILLWYPPPLEGTVIHIRFKNREVNVPVEEDDFRISD